MNHSFCCQLFILGAGVVLAVLRSAGQFIGSPWPPIATRSRRVSLMTCGRGCAASSRSSKCWITCISLGPTRRRGSGKRRRQRATGRLLASSWTLSSRSHAKKAGSRRSWTRWNSRDADMQPTTSRLSSPNLRWKRRTIIMSSLFISWFPVLWIWRLKLFVCTVHLKIWSQTRTRRL